MKTMENEIYNAIQKGLSNVLVFDDNDSSISYQKSVIDNAVNFPAIPLDDLYDIFKIHPYDIFEHNTKGTLTLILADGQEISLHEYKNSINPVFLKISNDILKASDNEIIIACNNDHYIPQQNKQWQYDRTQILADEYLTNIKQADNDFDGYKKCQMILKNKSKKEMPAINYCVSIESPLSDYKGYLPSIGQLIFMIKYLDMINYIFEYINVELLNLNTGFWWSSSEKSCDSAQILYYGDIDYSHKTYSNNVLPIFKQL